MRTDLEQPLKFKDLLRSAAFAPAYFVASGAVVVAAMYFAWFGLQHRLPLSPDPADWGAFGDYFGGVMNPICAYMAFVWLVRSYSLQKTELAETREALEKTQKAQQRHAEVALAAARIEAANIRLSILVTQANTQRLELSTAKAEQRRGVFNREYENEVLPSPEIIHRMTARLAENEGSQLEILTAIAEIESALLRTQNGSD